MARGHQRAAVAARIMSARAKAMAARTGAKAKVRKAEEREFMVQTLWDRSHGDQKVIGEAINLGAAIHGELKSLMKAQVTSDRSQC